MDTCSPDSFPFTRAAAAPRPSANGAPAVVPLATTRSVRWPCGSRTLTVMSDTHLPWSNAAKGRCWECPGCYPATGAVVAGRQLQVDSTSLQTVRAHSSTGTTLDTFVSKGLHSVYISSPGSGRRESGRTVEERVAVSENINLTTSIAGNINRVEFTASGEGIASDDGHSESWLRFSTRVPNFTPMLCKSWQCKHHQVIASLESDRANPLVRFLDEGGIIFDRTEVEYPRGNGRILMTSHISRPNPGIQAVFQTRIGEYSGPDDIVRQLPFDQITKPSGAGRAVSESVRRVMRSTGDTISIAYTEEVYFSPEFELPFSLITRIGGEATYDVGSLTFTLQTDVRSRELVAA